MSVARDCRLPDCPLCDVPKQTAEGMVLATSRLVDQLLDRPDLDASFRNWHLQGVDYLCLLRSERLTIKLYSFGDVPRNAIGLNVWPHNHRYSFVNLTLTGRIEQVRYEHDPKSVHGTWQYVECFPMRQGEPRALGFGLNEVGRSANPYWCMTPREIHAIRAKPGSLALQFQFEDLVPAHEATRMFVLSGTKPKCSGAGMYEPISSQAADEITLRARKAFAEIRSGGAP